MSERVVTYGGLVLGDLIVEEDGSEWEVRSITREYGSPTRESDRITLDIVQNNTGRESHGTHLAWCEVRVDRPADDVAESFGFHSHKQPGNPWSDLKHQKFSEHVDAHHCGDGGEPFFGFMNCPEAKRLWDLTGDDGGSFLEIG